jgi:hypothetical protein
VRFDEFNKQRIAGASPPRAPNGVKPRERRGFRSGADEGKMVAVTPRVLRRGFGVRGSSAAWRALAILVVMLGLAACTKGGGDTKPKQREPAPERDKLCVDPALPRAYFYPAENRNEYKPDDPFKDGCQMLVPDHLFCCPLASP